MANYAKQFLEELKVTIEAHLNTLTTDKDLVQSLMKAFKMPDDPKPEDVDHVIHEHSEHLQHQMVEMLSNKAMQQDSNARLDQARLFANANVFIPPLMTKERSNFLENQFAALERTALDAGVDQKRSTPSRCLF
jgi:hypothetical protein